MIREYIVCVETIVALTICLIVYVILSQKKVIFIRPSKEKMANVVYSHDHTHDHNHNHKENECFPDDLNIEEIIS